MTIARADFERLVAELNAKPFNAKDWLGKVGIERDAMAAVLNAATEQFVMGIARGNPPPVVLQDMVGNAFLLGWTTRDQYGRADARPDSDPKPPGSI